MLGIHSRVMNKRFVSPPATPPKHALVALYEPRDLKTKNEKRSIVMPLKWLLTMRRIVTSLWSAMNAPALIRKIKVIIVFTNGHIDIRSGKHFFYAMKSGRRHRVVKKVAKYTHQ